MDWGVFHQPPESKWTGGYFTTPKVRDMQQTSELRASQRLNEKKGKG